VAPLALRESKIVRLERLYRGAVYKEELGQVQLPLSSGSDLVELLVAFLGEVVPQEA
jgi:hypothetical protein